MDVRSFTVGPLQENCHIVRADGSAAEALVVDPGAEPERLLAALAALEARCVGILLTHTHFDHIGAVAPLARATGAKVWCPRLELEVLADPMPYVPPGLGEIEGHRAEEALAGGERLELAGLEIEVLFTPGHSPGHISYAVADAPAVLSGDVLFRDSVGRTDLPGGDWLTLLASIATLTETLPADTRVYPGHMAQTTLGRELQSNPFLRELAST